MFANRAQLFEDDGDTQCMSFKLTHPLLRLNRQSLMIAGSLSLSGCESPLTQRVYYPNERLPGDVLAHDPCTVKREPDIIVRGENEQPEEPGIWESLSGRRWTPKERLERVTQSMNKSLSTMRKINPVFLCGLERIEILGERHYKASLSPGDSRPSAAHYDHEERVLRLRLYADVIPVVHELAHHIHNLGIVAPTIREFLSKTWTYDAGSDAWTRSCDSIALCFRSEGASASEHEDWARSFESFALNPIAAWTEVGISLAQESATPLEQKAATINRDIAFERPLQGTVSIGAAQRLDASHFQILDGSELYLLDADSKKIASYRLQGRRFQKNSAESNLPTFYVESDVQLDHDEWQFAGRRAGPWFYVVGRKQAFDPMWKNSGHLGIHAINFSDPQAGRRLSLGQEPALGRFGRQGEDFYFFRGKTGQVGLWRLGPADEAPASLQEWSFAGEWEPVYVVPLQGADDLAVLAYNREKTNLLNTEAAIIRISPGAAPRIAGRLEQLDGDDMSPPITVGDHLLFPVFENKQTRLGFFAYDLVRDEFRAVQLQKKSVPATLQEMIRNREVKNLQILPASADRFYLIVSAPKTQTLIAPIKFSLPRATPP